MSIKLSELADKLGLRLHGEDCQIDNVADLEMAENGQLAFVYNPKYLDAIKVSRASAIIIKEDWLESCDKPALISSNPRLDFAKAATLLNPVKIINSGVADTACIAEDVSIADTVSVGHNAVIGLGVTLGENVQIGPGTVIANDVRIGDNTVVHANVTIGYGTEIGNNCTIFSGVVIGADGFGYARDGDAYFKIPQLGKVVIGDNVDIGANTTVDRGALRNTVIHDGVKIDNQVQVAHNVVIGRHTVISAYTGIAGSVKIGEHCLIGGGVGVRDNIEITDNVVITGRTFVSSSLTEPGSYSSSVLVDDTAKWRKNVMRFKHLDEMAKRLARLEKTLNEQKQ
jgi:UDP-3-O-[3-hydroxymyristoyl] glucosamine N-acyltransferase